MQALLLLVVFGGLAGVFTRLCAFPPVAGCCILVLNWSSRIPYRGCRHWRPGLAVASGACTGRRAAGLVLLALAVAPFHVIA